MMIKLALMEVVQAAIRSEVNAALAQCTVNDDGSYVMPPQVVDDLKKIIWKDLSGLTRIQRWRLGVAADSIADTISVWLREGVMNRDN